MSWLIALIQRRFAHKFVIPIPHGLRPPVIQHDIDGNDLQFSSSSPDCRRLLRLREFEVDVMQRVHPRSQRGVPNMRCCCAFWGGARVDQRDLVFLGTLANKYVAK